MNELSVNQLAADYENAHAALDMLGIPRNEDSRTLTLTERVGRLRHRFVSLKLQMSAMGDCLRGIDKAAKTISFPAPAADLYALVQNIRQQIANARAYVRERARKDKTGSFRRQDTGDFVPPSQRTEKPKGRRKRPAMVAPPPSPEKAGPVKTQRQLWEEGCAKDERGRPIPWQLAFYHNRPRYGHAPVVEGPPPEAFEGDD